LSAVKLPFPTRLPIDLGLSSPYTYFSSTMLCEKCQKNIASVHVTELSSWHGAGHPDNEVRQEHLCEPCGQLSDLPFSGPMEKMGAGIWGLINIKADEARPAQPSLSCDSCGLTKEEFQRTGRLGCEHCYVVFAGPLEEMLERMHGATQHVGRLPGIDNDELERERKTSQLRCELESAIAEEAYERAAGLRDELRSLGADEG
jgi:protein arginine kinase activator